MLLRNGAETGLSVMEGRLIGGIVALAGEKVNVGFDGDILGVRVGTKVGVRDGTSAASLIGVVKEFETNSALCVAVYA